MILRSASRAIEPERLPGRCERRTERQRARASTGAARARRSPILRPRADKVRDKLLLRRIFGLMISHPGQDRFAFHIFENGRGHLLEFPNLTTGISPELIAELQALVGMENIRIEQITFQ